MSSFWSILLQIGSAGGILKSDMLGILGMKWFKASKSCYSFRLLKASKNDPWKSLFDLSIAISNCFFEGSERIVVYGSASPHYLLFSEYGKNWHSLEESSRNLWADPKVLICSVYSHKNFFHEFQQKISFCSQYSILSISTFAPHVTFLCKMCENCRT